MNYFVSSNKAIASVIRCLFDFHVLSLVSSIGFPSS